MNPLPTPVRRNASRQEIQHIADILAGLDIEADGAAQILEAMDAALANSFYAAISHSPLLAMASQIRNLEVEFFREPANPAALDDAKAFGAGMRPVVREPREIAR